MLEISYVTSTDSSYSPPHFNQSDDLTDLILDFSLQKYANNDLFVKKNPELNQSSHHSG